MTSILPLSPTRTALALAALAACGTAFAQSPIDETRSVSATAKIEVSNIKGSVTLTAWDKPEVRVVGTLGAGAKRLAVEGGGDHLAIKVEPPDRQGWFTWGADTRMGETVLDIKVPREAELKIEVVSADVTVSGVAGRALDVDGVSGKLHLDSGAKEVNVDSVSGDIDLAGSATRAHVETVSGNIRARGLGGQLKFETVSGDIDAQNAGYSEVNAGTVSGDITISGKPEGSARVEVESMSGSVHLRVPADLSARLSASSFSGRIRSDFGSVKEPEHGPGSSLDASAGSGAGQVKLESFSGDIDIRKD